jgi:tRNA modification GTPase
MSDLTDTIAAVSSAGRGVRSIIRITGPETQSVCRTIAACQQPEADGSIRCIAPGRISIDADIALDVRLYLFFAPHSYTGEDLAEIHVEAGQVLVEALMERLLACGVRPAGPGEFTARAYLNGKLDLTQAEAVNEVVSSSNRFQLDAAERLLTGRLAQQTDEIRSALLDIRSLIEAGLDFSGEDIEFISAEQAAERLTAVRDSLERLRAGSIRYESLIDLPAVGIAGAPNAGKSSLLNALLGARRSIVSERPKTTRDVLSGVMTAGHFQCVLFDCAGLVLAPEGILDTLAQRAALEALHHCQAVLFCVDAAKPDRREDLAVRELIDPQALLCVATKCDLLTAEETPEMVGELGTLFGAEFLPTSAETGAGLETLRRLIREKTGTTPAGAHEAVALTARHRQAVSEAIESVSEAVESMKRGNDEVAAMMIRTADQALADIGHEHVDEKVLERIFSRFCIGK